MKILIWLKKERMRARMTQQEVADIAGITRPHYAHIELGKYEPRDFTKYMIAEAIGFDVELWEQNK